MADAEVRSAARVATLVALPLAVIAGLIAFFVLRPAHHSPTAKPSASAKPGSTTVVTMPTRTLSDADATVCRAFIAALPNKIRDLAQRRVSAGAEQNAAYGDPPITVACGVPLPTPQADVFVMNNVCWYPVQLSDRTIWTTLDRKVPVMVTIPPSYQQPGQWANEFSAAVISAVPSQASKYCK